MTTKVIAYGHDSQPNWFIPQGKPETGYGINIKVLISVRKIHVSTGYAGPSRIKRSPVATTTMNAKDIDDLITVLTYARSLIN